MKAVDNEYKRAIRIAVVFGMISLIAFMFLTFYVTIQIRKFNDIIVTTNSKLDHNIIAIKKTPNGSIQIIKGTQGAQGNSGIQGSEGSSGIQGAPGAQGVQGIQGVPGIQGDKGDKGDTGNTGTQGEPGPAGAPGRTVYERTNPVTGEQECRYAGSDDWHPAEECQ